MWIKEKRTVTETREVDVECRCDICGKKIDRRSAYSGDIDIRRSDGPDGGGEWYDVCADCWENHIVPLMKNDPGVF
jgi:hypothetical protein